MNIKNGPKKSSTAGNTKTIEQLAEAKKFFRSCELIIWLPQLFAIVLVIYLERSLQQPIDQKHFGLQLNMKEVCPENVFKPVLERSPRYEIKYPFTLGRKDTGLGLSYVFIEQGHTVQSSTDEKLSLYGPTNWFSEFPRLLIYRASPKILRGTEKLEGPDDVNIPVIPEQVIRVMFDKVVEETSIEERRLSTLFYRLLGNYKLAAAGSVLFIWLGGWGVSHAFMAILWSHMLSDNYFLEAATKVFEDSELREIFSDNFLEWGIRASLVPLPGGSLGDYCTTGIFLISKVMLSWTIIAGYSEFLLCLVHHFEDSTTS